VFYLKRKYLVKIFDKNLYLASKASKKNVDAPKQRDENVEKFNGFNETELESHAQLLFEDVKLDNFLDLVVSELFEQKINFAKIDTNFFEKYALRAIRDILASELTHHTDANKEYLLGFAGYIFRKNFHTVYLKIASVILEEIANDNRDALDFLIHYSGETILVDGVKYKMPALEKEDGSKWNVQSAIAISNMWINTKHKIDKLSISLSDIDAKLNSSSDAEVEIQKLKQDKNALEEELNALNSEITRKKFDTNVIKEFQGHSDDFQTKLTSMKEKTSQLETKISELESDIETMMTKEKEAITEKRKLLLLQTNVNNDMNILNQNLKVNNKLYQSILSALANALTKKRVMV
jgi:chaperonin cofactor prefoldin